MSRALYPWIPCCVGTLLGACAGPGLTWGNLAERKAPVDLRAYHDGFYAELGTRFVQTAPPDVLTRKLAMGAALFLGDYHTDRALHHSHLELLRSLATSGVRGVLLIEAIGSQDQEHVDGFLSGTIQIEDLRARIKDRWEDSWLDNEEVDFDYFRALLILAREVRWPILALEETPRRPLPDRDEQMARSLAEAAATHPDLTPIVIVGQSHLLGSGRLVERHSGPSVVIAARTNQALFEHPSGALTTDAFLRSDRNVWFFRDHRSLRPSR